MIKNTLIGTILSILIFFSISFLTVLTQINPFHYYKNEETYQLNIGFPLIYYNQFWLSGSNIPNSGWTVNYLFFDCILTWVIVTGTYIIWLKIKKK
jgi:hypothetical protein